MPNHDDEQNGAVSPQDGPALLPPPAPPVLPVMSQPNLLHLSVHLRCGELRGPVRHTPSGGDEDLEQRCRCQPEVRWPGADVSETAALCLLCARGTAGGRSRWSWLVCEQCKKLVRASDDPRVALLPIGRHSIMNQRGVQLSAPARSQRVQQAALRTGIVGWQGLRRWGLKEVGLLAAAFPGEQEVPLARWQTVHPPSAAASADAIARSLHVVRSPERRRGRRG